jgi:endonuclease G, mitochondrial
MYFIPTNNNGEKPQKNNNNKWLLLTGAAILILSFFCFQYFQYNKRSDKIVSSYSHDLISSSILSDPGFLLPETNKGEEIVVHKAYTLSYSEKDEEPFWVCYILKRQYLDGNEKRATRFEEDPDVGTGSAKPGDYRNSGFDKGHMAPAADMKWDKEAMKESFYLSNVCPQDHRFNDGIWADLENAVRRWVSYDSVEYIVTGPVLPERDALKIGEDHVTVPSYFYKVILSPYPYPKAIGFIIPNKPGRQSFWNYACTLSQVETTTHLCFFPKLPKDISSQIKNHFDIKEWGSRQPFDNSK